MMTRPPLESCETSKKTPSTVGLLGLLLAVCLRHPMISAMSHHREKLATSRCPATTSTLPRRSLKLGHRGPVSLIAWKSIPSVLGIRRTTQSCRKCRQKQAFTHYRHDSCSRSLASHPSSATLSTTTCSRTTRSGQPHACNNSSWARATTGVICRVSANRPRWRPSLISELWLLTIATTTVSMWTSTRSSAWLRNNYSSNLRPDFRCWKSEKLPSWSSHTADASSVATDSSGCKQRGKQQLSASNMRGVARVTRTILPMWSKLTKTWMRQESSGTCGAIVSLNSFC